MASRRRRTPSRPLALPDVRDFGELFSRWAPWPSGIRVTSPIPPVRVPAADVDFRTGRERRAHMEIGPYLSVQPGFHSFAVAPTSRTVEAIQNRTLSIAYDTISFEVILWDFYDALVVAAHNRIIGSVWLAVVDPLTVPGWLPSLRARELVALARQERSGDAFLVAADAIEEDGGEDFEELATKIRKQAQIEYRLERRRLRRRPV